MRKKIYWHHLTGSYYVIGVDRKTHIVILGGAIPIGLYRAKLSNQSIPTIRFKNVDRAKMFAGYKPKNTQIEKMLQLFQSKGETTTQEAKAAGINNPSAQVKFLSKKGHNISKVEAVRRDNGFNHSYFIYIYISPPNNK